MKNNVARALLICLIGFSVDVRGMRRRIISSAVRVGARALLHRRNLSKTQKQFAQLIDLEIASGHCRVTETRQLLAGGADPNLRFRNGTSPLHRLGQALHDGGEGYEAAAEEIVNLYVAAGVDLYAKDKFGNTILHGAAACGVGALLRAIGAPGLMIPNDYFISIDSRGPQLLNKISGNLAWYLPDLVAEAIRYPECIYLENSAEKIPCTPPVDAILCGDYKKLVAILKEVQEQKIGTPQDFIPAQWEHVSKVSQTVCTLELWRKKVAKVCRIAKSNRSFDWKTTKFD